MWHVATEHTIYACAGVGVNDWIRKTIEAPTRSLALQLAIAAACLAVATALRMSLKVWAPTGIPYITYFPVLVVAGVVGGRTASLVCLACSAALGSYFFVEAAAGGFLPPSGWAGIGAFLISGGLIVWLCDRFAQSVRALREANDQEHLLALELQHRVKNTLAIVQAIAHQTMATRQGPAFREAFTDRLVALGQAHNLLSESAWRSVGLEPLIRGALAPFVGDSRRLRLEGPTLQLPADLVIDLALCLHELAANATKHGALSNATGYVEVRWSQAANGGFDLTWTEHGGPRVEAPKHRGFGSRLLARGLGKNKPSVATEYRPEGLRWNVRFTLAAQSV